MLFDNAYERALRLLGNENFTCLLFSVRFLQFPRYTLPVDKMPSGAKRNDKCKKKCPPAESLDLPHVCLIEKPQRTALHTGCIKLPKACECPKPCEYIQRPRILANTQFIEPSGQSVHLTAPVGRARPKECVEIHLPSVETKPCTSTAVKYKRTDLPLCKPCPNVVPPKISQDECFIQLPTVTIQDVDCHVKLETEPFKVPCPEVKCVNVDVPVPIVRSKPLVVCIELPEFCPPELPPDCPSPYVPC